MRDVVYLVIFSRFPTNGTDPLSVQPLLSITFPIYKQMHLWCGGQKLIGFLLWQYTPIHPFSSAYPRAGHGGSGFSRTLFPPATHSRSSWTPRIPRRIPRLDGLYIVPPMSLSLPQSLLSVLCRIKHPCREMNPLSGVRTNHTAVRKVKP